MATQQTKTDPGNGTIGGLGSAPRIEHRDAYVGDGEPAVTDLVKRLAAEGGDLVRNEIALAKLEMRDMARQMAMDSAKLGVAIGIAVAGLLVLLAAAVMGLAVLLGGFGEHYALSALIIGGVMLLVGGILARSGIAGLKSPPKPDQTVQSLQNTRDWAGREAREFKEEVKNS